MAGARIRVENEEVIRMMMDIGHAFRDFRPALKKAGVYMEGSIGNNFRAGGRPKWVALSPATIRQRRKRSNRPLQDTGTLKASVTSAMDIRKMTATTYEFGTAKFYAPFHQFGTSDIPARPFLLFQPQDEVVIRKIFEEHVRRVTK